MGNSTYGKNRAEIAANTAHQSSDGIDHSIVNAITTFAKTLLDDVTAAAMRTTLGAAASGSNSDITALTALTNITPGGDFTLTQNSVVPFTSVESGAVANTLYLKSGKVGIFTASPFSQLDLGSIGNNSAVNIEDNVGGIRLIGQTGAAGAYQSIIYEGWESGISGDGAYIQFLTNGNNDHDIIFGGYMAGVAVNRMVIEANSGNVGIGTMSPTKKLVLDGTAPILEIRSGGYLMLRPTANDSDMRLQGGGTQPNMYIGFIGPGGATFMAIRQNGNVGIGTVVPNNPLAINRSADGIIVDFQSAGTIEGDVSISGNATSYNAFVGSHYTQLKDGQKELPIGAVVVSTGEIISCAVEKDVETEVVESEAVDIVTIANAVEEVSETVEDKENQIDEKIEYKYDIKTDTKEEIKTPVYGTKTISVKQFKTNICFDNKTGKFCKLRTDIVKNGDKFYLKSKKVDNVPNKEYFTYMDTTNIAGDKKVYGVWFGKASNDAKGQSFGDDSKPVYLIAQVGLFKIRVTDTNGNIANGDYLETSSRAMEAQKQTVSDKLNSTIGKAMIDVNWSMETSDSELGYKWKLIPVTF